jgi:ElaB/YqjD/DUF883 family membrane-anchored ribosome-binding protein
MRERDADELDEHEPAEARPRSKAVSKAKAKRHRFDADFLLDKVIPGEIDWRDLVRRHPVVSVSLVAAVGFLIGRAKGGAIVAGASAAVSGAVMRQLSDVLEGDVFDF